MKLRIRRADPAGNITLFVMSKADRKDYAAISNQLLAMEEFGAEQVGLNKIAARWPAKAVA